MKHYINTLAVLLLLSLSGCDALLPMIELDYTLEKHDLSFGEFRPENNHLTSNYVTFQWGISEGLSQFHLQVSDNNSFSGTLIIDENNLTENSYDAVLDLGTYFWRVCFFYDGQWKPWSETQKLVVSEISLFGYTDLDFEYQNIESYIDYQWSRSGTVMPYLQQEKVYSGEYALCLETEDSYDKSIVEITLNLTTDARISFQSYGNINGDFEFYIDYQPGDSYEYCNEHSGWSGYSSTVIAAGTHTLRWRFYQTYNYNSYQSGSNTAYLDSISIIPVKYDDQCNPGFENVNGTGTDIVTFNYSGDEVPFIQSDTVREGSNALCFVTWDLYDESITELTLNLTTAAKISFQSYVNSYGYFEFYIDYQPGDSYEYRQNSSGWSEYSSPVIAAGTHTLRWRYYQNSYQSGSSTAYLDSIAIIPLKYDDQCNPGFENVNGTGTDSVTFNYSGDDVPFIQSGTVREGSNALCFGTLDQDDESIAELTLNLTTAARISFQSYGNSYGDFEFYIDYQPGVSYEYRQNSNGWSEYSSPVIAAGTHTLRWRYYQKYYQSGSSTAYLDSIMVTPIDGDDQCDPGFENVNGTGTDSVTFNYSGDEVPFIQSGTVQEGSNALCFETLDQYDESIAELTLNLTTAAKISFQSYGNSSGYFEFYIDYQPGHSYVYRQNSSGWSEYSSPVIAAGTHTLRWRYYKNSYQSGSSTAYLDSIAIENINIESLVNFESSSDEALLIYSGDADPFIQSSNVNSGNGALQFGSILNSEDSIVTYSVTIDSAKTLQFYYSVSSERSFDKLDFKVDGTTYLTQSGEINWKTFSHHFTSAGTYTLSWTYSKDSSSSSGSDTAWIDDVIIY